MTKIFIKPQTFCCFLLSCVNELFRTYLATHSITQSRRQFRKLKADIVQNGVREPIKYVVYQGEKFVVDGHHRLKAARDLRLREVPVEEVQLPFGGYRDADDLINTDVR